MEKRKLKFVDEAVCFQEVPNETTLSFSISNCPHKCPGCHSAYLAEDIGIPLEDVLKDRLDYHEGLITCVLFMGGDDPAQEDSLVRCAQYCKNRGYKTALYSGAEFVPEQLWQYFDYVKTGPYIESLGGLDSRSTNQKMFKHSPSGWVDVTEWFQTKGLRNIKIS